MGIGYMLGQLVGILYPTYASFKAIETPESEDDKQWLTYWVIQALVLLVETWVGWLFMWFPFYDLIKLLVTLWMIAPQTQGAKVLYEEFVKPFLVTHAAKFDPVFVGTQRVMHLEVTNKVAKMVEAHGPTAADKMLKAVFSVGNNNVNKLLVLAEKNPQLLEQAMKMVVDTIGKEGERVGK